MGALARCGHRVWNLDDGGLRCATCGGRPFADYFRPQVEAEAKAVQVAAGKERGRGAKGSGKLPEAIGKETRDLLAAKVGMSGKTLEKATPLRRSGWGPWEATVDVGGERWQ